MTVHVSPSIVLRTYEFGETDLIVSFFTRDRGRLKGVAKGARKSRKRFSNCLDPFSLANLEYEQKSERNLYFLHSGRLIQAFPAIRNDFSAMVLASYMVELAEILFPEGVKAEPMFDLLRGGFLALEGEKDINRLRVFFEMRAMNLGGYRINLERCCICKRRYQGEGRAVFLPHRGAIACLKCARESRTSPGISPMGVKALVTILSMPLARLGDSTLEDGVISEITPVLRLHTEYRIGRRLKSAAFLE